MGTDSITKFFKGNVEIVFPASVPVVAKLLFVVLLNVNVNFVLVFNIFIRFLVCVLFVKLADVDLEELYKCM